MNADPIDSLVAKGFDSLKSGNLDEAIEVGEMLLSKRHSSGFEILALAYGELGDTNRAIAILEDGTRKVPTVWILWRRLGNFRTELGLFAQAYEAYESALNCPGVDRSCVYLNRSMTEVREGRFEEASKTLDLVDDPELRNRVESHRLDIYNRQGKHDHAIKSGEVLLAKVSADDDAEVRSMTLVGVGYAYWRGKGDGERAIKYALEATECRESVDEALWLIRAVDSQSSANANIYRLIVEGDWHEVSENGNSRGFCRHFEVVADNETEALTFARRLEPERTRSSLRIHECRVIEERCEQPKGVYDYSCRVFYELDRQDDEP